MTILQIDEQALVKKAQSGDTKAFAELVTMHSSLVYNLCLRTLGNAQEAEDAAQETFLRAWQSLSRFRSESQLSTWLYRIATNLCYNRLPHLQRELSTLDPDEQAGLADRRQNVEERLATAETVNMIDSAVNQLPNSYRLLVALRHMQGLSYADIAEVTGMPLGSVKTGIFRARRQLREILSEEMRIENG